MRGLPRIAVVIAILGSSMSVAKADEGDSERDLPRTPTEYERYALDRHLELKSLHQRWHSTRSEAEAAGARWPQPVVHYQTRVDTPLFQGAAGRHTGSISQQIPWPGVLDRASEPAENRAEAVRHRFQARTLEVVFETRRLLIEIARIDELVGILDEQRRIYGDVRENLETSMESDQADYGDLLRVATKRETVTDRIETLRSKRRQRVDELREVLDFEKGADLAFEFEGEHDPLNVPGDEPERAELLEAASQNHPELAAKRAEADASRSRAEYARAKRLPWPSVSLGVQSRPLPDALDGPDRRTALLIGVSVPLPLILSQYRHERRQFERREEAVLVERERTTLDLEARIASSITRIEEKRSRLERYRGDLLPLADDATEHMLQKIETGERTVTDYLLSFEQQLDLETNVVEFRASIATERARLEMLTGGEFDAFPHRPTPEIEIREARLQRDNQRDDERSDDERGEDE